MTYLVTEACIKCKYQDCVSVCPVDCFYEGENMVVINPSECIDCGVCEPECPVNAIVSNVGDAYPQWLAVNEEYSAIWPNIAAKGEVPPDAADFDNLPDKFEKFFSPGPGQQ